MKPAYDEMYSAPGQVRESYRGYADWLQGTSAEVIARKREEADIAFHRVGITAPGRRCAPCIRRPISPSSSWP